jgi:hypothetical protein
MAKIASSTTTRASPRCSVKSAFRDPQRWESDNQGDITMWETMDFGDSSIIVAPVAEIMKQPGRKASIK